MLKIKSRETLSTFALILRKSLLFFLISLVFLTVKSQNSDIPFTFRLDSASKTSAGVYKKDGSLIRTLWSGVNYKAGEHKVAWDRKDDNGILVPDTLYTIKILSNNVKYTWEGVIGNTSDSLTGPSVIRMFGRFQGMAIFGNTAYYASGYGEGYTSAHKIDLRNPQNKTSILQYYSTDQNTDHVATDGKLVYWAGYDPLTNGSTSFTYATKVTDDSEVIFPSGNSVPTTWGRTYPSAIDLISGNPLGYPSGIAVQKKGNYLLVSHAGLNELHILNKSTGAIINIISISSPRALAVDSNDNLWMISGTNSVEKFNILPNGILSPVILSISGLSNPLAIAVSPDNSTVLIADAGNSQQLKAFDNYSGNLKSVFGIKGGYENGPFVQNNKFYFSDTVTGIHSSLLAFAEDGSFWVGDPGNERVQHYDSNYKFIERIMSLPHSYSVNADKNNPGKVFNEYLEFRIDYSKPLKSDNASWELVKNWRHGIIKEYYQDFKVNIFRNVTTFLNGRTYGFLINTITNKPAIVELPDTGDIRYTGIEFESFSSYTIQADGSLLKFTGDLQLNSTGYGILRALTGFDAAGNPQWGANDTIAIIPEINKYDPAYYDLSYPQITSSNLLVLFNPDKVAEGYHLGAIKVGGKDYHWKTAQATSASYRGPMPEDGSFDIGNGVEYAGGHAYAEDRNIFWNYHGEFWKGNQTNIWNHVYDNGLFVSGFGVTGPEGEARESREAYSMGAGNVFSSSLVKLGNDYFIYHNDESVHGGIHRWKISNLGSIKEQSINIIAESVKGGLLCTYFEGLELDAVKLKLKLIEPLVNQLKAPLGTKSNETFSARRTGFISTEQAGNYNLYLESNGGSKLWFDGKQLINDWKNTGIKEYKTGILILEKGKRYPIIIESNGNKLALKWSHDSSSKTLIPSANLFPSDNGNTSEGIDLMSGLPYQSTVENNMFGWKRFPENDLDSGLNNYWKVSTNVRSSKINDPDIQISFRNSSGFRYVGRSLGKNPSCLKSWKLSGTLNYEGSTAMFSMFDEAYIEVLDINGKVISRISHELTFNGADNPTEIKFNGLSVVKQPGVRLQLLTSRPREFSITADSSGIIFKYDTYTVKTTKLDAQSSWPEASELRIRYSGNPNNQDRTVSLSRLRFSGAIPSQIEGSNSSKLCNGDSIVLKVSKAARYRWSTGDTSREIRVKKAGRYNVTTFDINSCSTHSATTTIDFSLLKKPEIKRMGNTLFSLSLINNKWTLNGNVLIGDTRTIPVNQNGIAYLTISDSFLCNENSDAFNVFIQKVENPLIVPNPGRGKFRIYSRDNIIPGQLHIFDIHGLTILSTALSSDEIDISDSGPGMYFLEIQYGNNYFRDILIII